MQIVAGIVLLGVLITFHELGHFLFAKWLGVRVLVFSVGFGPKLLSFKKGETEYRLSAIPLGGYVRMFGESIDDNLSDEEKKMSFMHQPIWRKSLIAFAGPLFNFILPVILFFFLSLGVEQVFAPQIGTLAEGGVAEKAGLKPNDLIIRVSKKPVTTFSEVAEIIAKSADKELTLTLQRKNEEGTLLEFDVALKPESKDSTNPLERDQKIGRIGIMPAIELPVISVSDESPLAKVGLKDLDEIVRVDQKVITNATDLMKALKDLKPKSAIEVRRTPIDGGDPELVTIEAPTELLPKLALKPTIEEQQLAPKDISSKIARYNEETKTILSKEQEKWRENLGIASANGLITELTKDSLASKLGLSVKDRLLSIDGEKIATPMQVRLALSSHQDTPHVLGALKNDGTPLIAIFMMPTELDSQVNLDTDILLNFGIKTASVFKPGELIERRVGPFEALKRASLQTADIAYMTGKSLWLMAKREVPASQIGGPIMLFDVAQQAAKKGLSYYIFIMCLLSVNLGLLNLLPIPALDGGHLLLFGIEAVQRKPLTARTRNIATQIGIAILLLIMAFAILNDITRLFR